MMVAKSKELMQMNKNTTPKVSVVMSTYNDGKYINKAVSSILNQTFSDLELIIVNDASTDNTLELLSKINDPRVIVISNEENSGLAYSLNRGFSIARGEYIARMDSDDISLPDRIWKQYNYMEKHKDITVCGCLYKCFERSNGVVTCPKNSDRIKTKLLFCSPLGHSTWFIRKKDFDENKIRYNPNFKTSQDYDLMYRIKDKFKLACMQEVLVLYRVRKGSITGKTVGIDKNILRVQRRILKDLHIPITKVKLELLNKYNSKITLWDFIRVVFLSVEIIKGNRKYNIFNPNELELELEEYLSVLWKRVFE